MVDWKKDLKLSDLLARDKGDVEADAEAKPFHQDEPAPVAPDAIEPGTHEEGEPVATPVWNRESEFGHPQADFEPEHDLDATAGDAEERSSSKQELSFGRGEAGSASDPDVDLAETDTEATPFWKRDLGFGRRRDDESTDAPVDLEPPYEQPDPPATDHFSNADTENIPFWKRRLSFGRSGDPDFDAPESERRSFFRPDFSFRRSKDPDFDVPREAGERKLFGIELNFRRGRRDAPEVTATRRTKVVRRKQQFVGLKVGASQVAAARIVNNGSPELVQLARQPIEQGIVVGGELRDPDALADALRDFFAKHKLPNRNVRLGIGNNRIGVRSFEISGVHDPKQLENAIRFRAQEALPIPLDEAVLDYVVLDEAVSPTGIRTYRVLLVVAYRELIDRYVAACRGAGLRLVGIDLEAFALLRALSPPPSEGFPEDTALVAVSIGHDRSTFAVSTGTVCEFTRVLDWGGSSLNTAIARELDINPSQAEPVKRTLSLGGEDSGATTENPDTARAEEAVRLELQSFARELVSSLHFYQNQPGSLAIGTIMLTGGTAHMPGLAAELQRLIGVKVRVGDPLRRVKTAKRVEAPDQVGSMAIAIGLGIED